MLKHQKSEFLMRVGKHEAKVCASRRSYKSTPVEVTCSMGHASVVIWKILLKSPKL